MNVDEATDPVEACARVGDLVGIQGDHPERLQVLDHVRAWAHIMSSAPISEPPPPLVGLAAVRKAGHEGRLEQLPEV